MILVGEMRDRETAAAVVEASLTGHLVFSTLHTNSATQTIEIVAPRRTVVPGVPGYGLG